MHKKVLLINLNSQTFEAKHMTDLEPYIGGIGIGLKLLLEHVDTDPMIFSIGPLNGFFPFASKTSIVFQNAGVVEDMYIGGSLSSRIKFAGLDSIVIYGKSETPVIIDIQDDKVFFRSIDNDPDSLGLPGKKSVIKPVIDKFVLDGYFDTPEKFLEDKITQKNVRGIVVTGTKTFEIFDKDRYTELFNKILARTSDMTIEKGNNPSCVGCPMGCGKSKTGELGGNVLVHSLVGCSFSEPIFSDIGVVFSCLNVLGYHYTHEDIEALPIRIKEVLKELS